MGRWVENKAFRGEPVDRVPVGFWHHFTSEDEWLAGFGNQAIIEKNLAGHQAFLSEVEPDFIKLMSDGYFAYPNESLKKVQSIKELADIEPLGAYHPWISEQVELVQKIRVSFTEDLVAIYNIFAPVTHYLYLSGTPFRAINSGEFIEEQIFNWTYSDEQ